MKKKYIKFKLIDRSEFIVICSHFGFTLGLTSFLSIYNCLFDEPHIIELSMDSPILSFNVVNAEDYPEHVYYNNVVKAFEDHNVMVVC